MSASRVLAAVDFGEPSLEALRQARALAHGVSGTLGVVHVLPAVQDLHLLFPERSLSLAADTEAEAQEVRRKVEAHARAELGLELSTVFVERGTPYAEIIRRAEAWPADYVVVGSHGRTGLARMVLGSVAARVVRHAHCSVLVARSSRKSGIVLVATDLSPASLPAIEAGAAAARRTGAKLVAMTVLEWPGVESVAWAGLFGALPVVPSEQVQVQLRDAARTVLEQAVAATGADAEIRLAEGPVSEQIERLARELDAELLVVGTHGRTGLSRVALGSVAERVLAGSTCSVLAVRTRADSGR
jgi:nucleotide-binding universal stress UspA family protein